MNKLTSMATGVALTAAAVGAAYAYSKAPGSTKRKIRKTTDRAMRSMGGMVDNMTSMIKH